MHEAVSRATINSFDIGTVGAICVSYMETTGSPAHLRFLLRRLRQRAPGAAIILALWQSEAATQEWDGDLVRATQGAASTLREAVQQCLDAARASEQKISVSA